MRFSEFLRNRHPTISEYRPKSGLDPTTHAGLALKDAEKVMSIRTDSVKSYILKANALILVSTNFDNHLLNLERFFARTIGRRNRGKALKNDDFDCTLCLKLPYEPVTTPCGHSFCRSCLFQSIDRSNRCPLCRTVCFVTPRTCAISVTLNNIIQKNFPEEYAERMSEHENMANPGVDMLPLFVMDVTLPCQKF